MKELSNTKVTVHLRKNVSRNEWYLYLEAYPVYIKGRKGPQRKREYLNRSVTTVIWDKKRTARTTEEGKKTYKPKRDENGIILCRSEADQQTCIYADGVRNLRQKEYDNADLYTEEDKRVLEQKRKNECDFIAFMDDYNEKRNRVLSTDQYKKWGRTIKILKLHSGGEILFKDITEEFCEDFRLALLSQSKGLALKGEKISQNTASYLYGNFRSALHIAFLDGYFTEDIAGRLKPLRRLEVRREYLTTEELNKLANTPCSVDVIKRAALFSALTGLRHCDIYKLKWSEIDDKANPPRLNFTQQKTKGVEYKPISKQALDLCGPRRGSNDLVFQDLPEVKRMSYWIEPWLKAAGIDKKITFHCFRHTFATLQLANGTDIYTVSKMLGHTNVKTTQIYAKIVDSKKDEAANAIVIDFQNDTEQ